MVQKLIVSSRFAFAIFALHNSGKLLSIMLSILVYADSLSWGIVPGTRQRLAFDHRWPGILESTLNINGPRARVIEDCLNGRRTVWNDPFKPGRNGLEGLAQRIE